MGRVVIRVVFRAVILAAAVAGTACPSAARADFFDDVRRTFQHDIPRTFEHDIPRAFGAERRTPPRQPAQAQRQATPRRNAAEQPPRPRQQQGSR